MVLLRTLWRNVAGLFASLGTSSLIREENHFHATNFLASMDDKDMSPV